MFSSERLKGIDVLVCVAQLGSFKAAAEKMNLTASAISKSIARLESRLGVRLIHRTTRSFSLTDAGAAFYRTCTGVLADLEEAELALQAEHNEPRGRVRIDLPGAFGRAQVLPLLLRFAQTHPLLVPHISFSDGLIDPFQAGVDVVVRIGSPDVWPDTVGHCDLGREWHTFCASPAYLAQRGVPLTDSDLEHHACIAYGWVDGKTSPWTFAVNRPGATLRRQVPAQLVVGNGEALVKAVSAGCGIAQLPSWLIKQQLDDGTLIEVLPHLAAEGHAINLAWIKSRQALPRVRAVLECLVEGLKPPDALSKHG
ncbi:MULTISPECIES: LysR family transcriptional regulator [Pseudomonas]|uniref:LysR family transcriptional regulator n=1 Tax=Pseudomonas TaxID=286 RepID=UPI001BE71323|nr:MULTISPECIES: LysR family transcriptional regulator [Pseudomonas]MBT2339881.1 LysR family transcriptional regulator [Pseudomonas fluorescens]MCD4530396.1 LysR family transcriptional regulator [Pseudomonas sp. C3-2018]